MQYHFIDLLDQTYQALHTDEHLLITILIAEQRQNDSTHEDVSCVAVKEHQLARLLKSQQI